MIDAPKTYCEGIRWQSTPFASSQMPRSRRSRELARCSIVDDAVAFRNRHNKTRLGFSSLDATPSPSMGELQVCGAEGAESKSSRGHIARYWSIMLVVFIRSYHRILHCLMPSNLFHRLMNSRTSHTRTLSSQAQVVHQPSAPNMHQSTPMANSVCASILPISLPNPAPLPPLSSVDPSAHTRQLMS
jgi:hypothetical protein